MISGMVGGAVYVILGPILSVKMVGHPPHALALLQAQLQQPSQLVPLAPLVLIHTRVACDRPTCLVC